MGPEFADHAPTAFVAVVGAPFDLPLLLNLGVAPWAVTHEWHQLLAFAFAIRAAGRVAAVAVLSVGGLLEARPVAPGAIVPIELNASAATGTLRGKAG